MSTASPSSPPALVDKAIRDAGLDLITPAENGAFLARISGTQAQAWIAPESKTCIWVALPLPNGERFGLEAVGSRTLPAGMATIGKVDTPQQLNVALRAACVLQLNTPSSLSQKVEQRLASIAVTERTQEVRQRIGQDVFREALFELWDGRCAVSGAKLPPELLRASHAKPWAVSNENERLDPFNGLLLAVHLDALFDSGLLTFDEEGRGMLSPKLSGESKTALGMQHPIRLENIAPGHSEYLRYHRKYVAKY